MNLPFVSKMQEYAAETAANIGNKQTVINNLQQKVNDKQAEINDLQATYNESPSGELFEDLLKLKAEIKIMKINVESAADIIQVPATKIVSESEIVKDINDFVDELRLQELKNNIATAKQEFLSSIDVYEQQIRKIKALKADLAGVTGIDKGLILKTLEGHKELYSCHEEIKYEWNDFDKRKAAMATAAADLYVTKF